MLPENLSHPPDRLVPLLVAKPVVDLFEAVDVGHQNAQRGGRGVLQPVDVSGIAVAVGKACERIVAALEFKLLQQPVFGQLIGKEVADRLQKAASVIPPLQIGHAEAADVVSANLQRNREERTDARSMIF